MKKYKPPLRVKTGFTLIEIVISFAIVAVGMVGILSLFPVGFDSARRSINDTQVSFYGQQTMAQIKLGTFPPIANTSGFPPIINATGTFADPNYSYSLVVSTATPSNYLRKVDLTINWQHRNRTYQKTFTTYVAKYAP